MDSLDDTKISSKMGFFKYLFKFDEDTKCELLNIIQYALIAFVPLILLNKGMQHFVPEADEDKGSFETLGEVFLQIIVMFVVLYYINRIILYVPTYSEQKYPEFSIIYIILAVLMITMSLQTKLGEKVSILYERVLDLWEGDRNDKKKKKKSTSSSGNVKIIQPFTNQYTAQEPQHQYGGGGTTSLDQLPSNPPVQQGGNANSEYLINNGPVAANEGFGGAFGASF
jgi:hypothetical protein